MRKERVNYIRKRVREREKHQFGEISIDRQETDKREKD
jgi:hypothetical protein